MKRSEPYPIIAEQKEQNDSSATKVDSAPLAEALLKVQKQLHAVKKDASNPFFKSKYATLQSTWEACREALQDAGLVIIQTIHRDNGVFLRTRLMHVSGAYTDSETPLLMKEETMQAMGSAISYARRYSLAAIIGLVTDEDDDGNAASKPMQTALHTHTNAHQAMPSSAPQRTFATISEAQAKRFYAMQLSRKVGATEMQTYLKSWGYTDAKQIKPQDYDAMCRFDKAPKQQEPEIIQADDEIHF